jgi:hypothetical protein
MGKADNRRTFKMKRKRAQAAKKARIKEKITSGKKSKKSVSKK